MDKKQEKLEIKAVTDIKELYRLLVCLIDSQITEKKHDYDNVDFSKEQIYELYKLSKNLDFAHVVYASLRQMNVPLDEELEKKFKKACSLAAYRMTMIEYEQGIVTKMLKDNGIPYILLKGAVIRMLYPKNVIRTSCDIDVLVKSENVQTAKEMLEKNGYTIVQNNTHDIPFMSPSGAKVELHFSITESGLDKANDILDNAWDYTAKDEKGDITFTKEFFLFHHFTHMAYHFIGGGCGIKPLCDLYFIQKQMGVTAEDIKDLLEKSGLYKFACEMTVLCRDMFDIGHLSDFDLALLSYIIEGGAYGRIDNKVMLGKSKSGGMVGYLLSRFFLPYKHMKRCYPILEKLPILLPVFWIFRIFHRLFCKRERFVSELNQSSASSREKQSDIREIQKRLGL